METVENNSYENPQGNSKQSSNENQRLSNREKLSLIVALITLIGAVLAQVVQGNYYQQGILIPIYTTQTAETKIRSLTPTATDTQPVPFSIIQSFDFDKNIVSPWISEPTDEKYPLTISDKFSCSGKQSLEQNVDAKLDTDGKTSTYFGVSLSNSGLSSVVNSRVIAATGNVLIPNTYLTKDMQFKAMIQGSISTDDPAGGYLVFNSKLLTVLPGNCMKIIWLFPDSYKLKDTDGKTISLFDSNGRNIYRILLMVWSDNGPYKGPVYYDDLTFYTYPD